ncbi:MAG: tetratricopeptide repeat protein [Acidobacteriota bacterium]|nr:tetratricopeptide repeat protein [Acidobacteriota bacterium]
MDKLGCVYTGQKKFKAAIVALERAAPIEPKNVETLFIISFAYAKQNRYREAIAEMQKVVRVNPKDEQAQLFLCQFYLLAKEKQSALAQYEAVKLLNPLLAQKLYTAIYANLLISAAEK